jgi:hypothetical protein
MTHEARIARGVPQNSAAFDVAGTGQLFSFATVGEIGE